MAEPGDAKSNAAAAAAAVGSGLLAPHRFNISDASGIGGGGGEGEDTIFGDADVSPNMRVLGMHLSNIDLSRPPVVVSQEVHPYNSDVPQRPSAPMVGGGGVCAVVPANSAPRKELVESISMIIEGELWRMGV